MGRKKDKKVQIEKRRQDRKKDMQMKKKLRQKMGKGDKFKLEKQYIEYAQKFNKQISVLRVKIRDVGGDGNCMFRAFADQIDGSEQSHKFMRQQACRYMTDNQEFFKPFLDEDQDGPFDKYIKLMLKDGQWGGHLQIQALCQCFKCIVVIHKTGLQQIIMRPMINDPTFGVIHLGYFQHEDFEHYVSIRELQDESQLPAIQKLKFLNKNMYEHLLYQDQEEYMIQKQLEQMQIIEKLQNEWNENEDKKNLYHQEAEPFPGYPKNKKCKCGSKLPYKNCCFKNFQKKSQEKFSSK